MSRDPSGAIDYFGKTSPLICLKTRQSLKARKAMFDVFMAKTGPTPTSKVIDIGVTPDRSLADSNAFEQFYPWKDRITATSFEDASFLEKQYPGLRFVCTDGRTLPFPDKEFDVAYSSAVLEHVGDAESQRQFIWEMMRISKRFYLAVPNRWFPLELHTFIPLVHWLPKPAHRRILRAIGKDFWSKETNLNLVGASEMRSLFPPEVDVHLYKHRLLGMPSNLVAYGTSPDAARRP